MISSPPRDSYAVLDVKRVNDSLVLTSQRGQLRLSPQNDSILRITYTENSEFSNSLGLGISFSGGFSDWEYTQNTDFITLTLPCIIVNVSKSTGAITYLDDHHGVLLKERNFESKVLHYFDAYKPVIDENTIIKEITTPDGVKKVIENASSMFDRRLCHTKLNLEFKQDEKIYGLGQAEEGVLNLRGTTQYLHQANMKIAIPFFVSSEGYGVLSATSGAAIFNDNQYGTYLYTDADTELDYYFIQGKQFDKIISGYRFLTGKATMLPKWAFGFIQSQERYETQQEILDMANEFERRNIGLDCLVLDWCSWQDGHWGQKTFDKSRFPNVQDMTRTLEQKNIHFMLSIWPNMDTVTDNYNEFFENKLLLPANNIYDAFNPEARKLYWKQINDGLFSNGVKSFWCDSSEPFTPEWSATVKPEQSVMYNEFVKVSSNFLPRDMINGYGLVHSQTIYEGQCNETNKYRVCNLTRNTYTGGQRYGTILWSGDTCASWETLKNQIVAGLNFCATGFPYWTLDIGAFFVKRGQQWFWNGDYDDTSNDLGYCELFTRWFQFGAFIPVFRSHGTDVRREIWNFGDEGDMFYDAIKNIIDLRYTLIPYIYSYAYKSVLSDSTILRMLAFDFIHDTTSLEIKDQFMFGESIMVCPVTSPMYYTANSTKIETSSKTRLVYLPQCEGFYNYHTSEKFSGGQWISVECEIDTIPLFVKTGSIIPVTKPVKNTAQSSHVQIDLHVYTGADATFTLYDDNGDDYSYEDGNYSAITFNWSEFEQKLYCDSDISKFNIIIHK